MEWHRKITSCLFKKEDPQWKDPVPLRIYIPSCGWGTLKEFNHLGQGYVSFDKGGGQLIRNWAHFLNMVEIIEGEE